MIYKNAPCLTIKQIKSHIDSGIKDMIVDGLLYIFMNNVNQKYAIDCAQWAMNSEYADIKKLGIIGIGHIARVYGLSDLSDFRKNIDIISKSNNPELLSLLEDAIDDFNIFKK